MFSKRIKYLLLLVGILILAYNISLFCLVGVAGHNAVFWITYSFLHISFAAILLSVILLESHTMRLVDWLFRLPLIKHSIIFVTVEFVVSVLFMFLSKSILTGVAVAVHIVILSIYLVFSISCMAAKNVITAVNQTVAANTAFIKSLRLDTDLAVQYAEEGEQKKSFEKLASEIRYSDPVSSAELAEIEGELGAVVKAALQAVRNKETEASLMYCSKASEILRERNMRCKLNKK